MTKNKLEKKFSDVLRNSAFWGMKLHNNPLAHQNTPADYIVHSPPFLNLIECKQVTCKEGKGRLTFKRLKQTHDLVAFENFHETHRAYYLIAFYDERWSNSDVYIIPANEIKDLVESWEKVSINREEMYQRYDYRKIELGDKEWLKAWLK